MNDEYLYIMLRQTSRLMEVHSMLREMQMKYLKRMREDEANMDICKAIVEDLEKMSNFIYESAPYNDKKDSA